jgi:mRNA interferase RelE/StbE
MAYTVKVAPSALRDLDALQGNVLKRVIKKIDTLAVDPRPPGSRKLSGSDDTHRVRVGDYRILYEIWDDVLLVLVVKIRHRREAYRN